MATDRAADREGAHELVGGIARDSSAAKLTSWPWMNTPDPERLDRGPTHFVCARCGESIGSDPAYRRPAESDLTAAADAGDDPGSRFDTWQWELDQELHDVRRLLQASVPGDSGSEDGLPPTPGASNERQDGDHFHDGDHLQNGAAGRVARTSHRIDIPTVRNDNARRRARPPLVAWFLLSVGLMALACGAVLLGWSLMTGRPDLWKLGVPAALGGQAGMVIGFLLLIERMWRENRNATDKLSHVDAELDSLRHTTTLLGESRESGVQRFYTHMAEGAHPHLLLADLKSQMDMLAVKIGER